MEKKQNARWNAYFGSAWQQVTAVLPGLGGFLVDHQNQTICLDENTKKLLGFQEEPDYTAFCHAIGRLQHHTELSSPLRIHILEMSDDVIAGFVNVEEERENVSLLETLPVISQTQLLSHMTEEKGKSLLALAKIEGAENPTMATICISSAVHAMKRALPERALLGAHNGTEFWIYVPEYEEQPEKLLQRVKQAVEQCALTDEFGVVITEHYVLTLTIGCSVESGIPSERMHTASFALYEAGAKGTGSISFFSQSSYELQKNEYHDVRLFSKLIEQNLFQYHFQPIVDAHTGEIVAYEALMRTDPCIGLNPLQVLNMAERFGRLYDIEKATLFNTLEMLSRNQSFFEKRKLFVNSITAHMLVEEDYQKLREDYGELMEKVVIELTEQTEITDETLEYIHKRLKGDNIRLAIDDYGTGYSNTSNLLRYNPYVVKIDRSLITGIDSNQKVQKIVSSIVEFLHASGYVALAEGVETYGELQYMISIGSDLIQGYYTSRPKPVLINDIADDIKNEIVQINLELSGEVQRVYRPVEGETVKLQELAAQKYTDILIDTKEVTLVGVEDQPFSILVNVKDEVECTMHLQDAALVSVSAEPVIKLGEGTNLRIYCEGNNSFERKGVLVPRTSTLYIGGTGNLSISADSKDCFAIGNNIKHSHGDIEIALDGRLSILANGDSCIGIGGGRNRDHRMIRIMKGALDICCSGSSCVGIGTYEGPTRIELRGLSLKTKITAPNAVSVGSMRGNAEIQISDYQLNLCTMGTNQMGIGVLEKGTGHVGLYAGTLSVTLKGMELSCVGTRSGNVDCEVSCSNLVLYGEGGTISGVGDYSGSGDVKVENSEVDITFYTSRGIGLGSPQGTLETVGVKKNIMISE